jgi:hypothetical protein
MKCLPHPARVIQIVRTDSAGQRRSNRIATTAFGQGSSANVIAMTGAQATSLLSPFEIDLRRSLSGRYGLQLEEANFPSEGESTITRSAFRTCCNSSAAFFK